MNRIIISRIWIIGGFLLLLPPATPHLQSAEQNKPVTLKDLKLEEVTERYSQGKVQLGMLKGEQKVTLGGTTYWLTGKARFGLKGELSSATLAKDVSVAINGTPFTFNKGTHIGFHGGFSLRYGYLSTQQPKVKVGDHSLETKMIFFDPSGNVSRIVPRNPERIEVSGQTFLFQDLRFRADGQPSGGTFEGNQAVVIGDQTFQARNVEFHDNGNVKGVDLAGEQPIKINNQTIMIESGLRLHDNGNVRLLRAKNGETFRVGEDVLPVKSVWFYGSGIVRDATLAAPLNMTVYGHKVVVRRLDYQRNGALKRVILDEPYSLRVGTDDRKVTVKSLAFDDDGNLSAVGLSDDQPFKLDGQTLTIYTLQLHQNGLVKHVGLREPQEIAVGNQRLKVQDIFFDPSGGIETIQTSIKTERTEIQAGSQTYSLPGLTYLYFDPNQTLLGFRNTNTSMYVDQQRFPANEASLYQDGILWRVVLSKDHSLTLGGKAYTFAKDSGVTFHRSSGVVESATLTDGTKVTFNADGSPAQ